MDPSNCVGLYHWARDLGATGLSDCALRFICQHFAQVGHPIVLIFSQLDSKTKNAKMPKKMS